MRFRSSSKRQALGVVFLLGMGVALVQAEIGDASPPPLPTS